MKTSRMESLAWQLIYGGAALLMLGLWTLDSDAALGRGLAAVGVLGVAGGALLVWLRSRRGAGPRDGAAD